MPGSTSADNTHNAMSNTPEEDDDMPALEAAVPPEPEASKLSNGATPPAPSPSHAQHPDVAAAKAYFLSLLQSSVTPPHGSATGKGATGNPEAAQNASGNAPDAPPAAAAPGNGAPPAGSSQGATPSGPPPGTTYPPPSFQAFLNALLAAGPPPSLSGMFGAPHTLVAAASSQSILSKLFGEEDDSEDDEEYDEEDDEDHDVENDEEDDAASEENDEEETASDEYGDMPPLQDAQPSATPPNPPAQSQHPLITYMLDVLVNASLNPQFANPPSSPAAEAATTASTAPSPWSSFLAHYLTSSGIAVPVNVAGPGQAGGNGPTATPGSSGPLPGGLAGAHVHGISLTVIPGGTVGTDTPTPPPNATAASADGSSPPPPGLMTPAQIDILTGEVTLGGEAGNGPNISFGPLPPFMPLPQNGAVFGPFNMPTFNAFLDSLSQAPSSEPQRPPLDAVAFVDSLDQVDIATIPAEDMRCPHCWLDFGTTEEDIADTAPSTTQDTMPVTTQDTTPATTQDITPATTQDITADTAKRQEALNEMPSTEPAFNNDPVRTPCGHIFGRDCLIESLQKVGTRCPTCRQELHPKAEAGASPVASDGSESDDGVTGEDLQDIFGVSEDPTII